MKSPVEEREVSSTTTGVINISKSSPNKNNYLFKHITKLATDHDVTVSGTMIKVTYKKALKDHYSSSKYLNGYNLNSKLVLSDKNMSTSMNKLNSHTSEGRTPEASLDKSVCDSDSYMVAENETSTFISKISENPVFHSTPKPDLDAANRRKREYVNGLNLLVKLEPKNFKENSHISICHQKPSITMNSDSSSINRSNLNSKPAHDKSNTVEKSVVSNIKIPKGITIIRLKGSANTNINEKKSVTENICLKSKVKKIINKSSDKDVKKFQIGLKRKFNLGEGVVATKIVKKSDMNSQYMKKKFIKTKVLSKAVDLNNTLMSVETNQNNKQFHNNSASGGNKKELLMVDPDLPPGWKRVILKKKEGTPQEKNIVYIFSPQGKKFQFKWKLRKYLERTNSKLCADQFHFGLYKRTKPSCVPSTESEIDKQNSDEVPLPAAQSSVDDSTNTTDKTVDSDKKQLLLFDPDLPFGWKRIINTNNSSGKLQVQIISPEGRIFRRRYGLNEYLTKHQYSYSLDRFYFGLYPKKDSSGNGYNNEEEIVNANSDVKVTNKAGLSVSNGKPEISRLSKNEPDNDDDLSSDRNSSGEDVLLSEADISKLDLNSTPMFEDPSLPQGWRRFIKIRSCGKSAGRMEVVVISPDGRRHRSKGQLENYLFKNKLSYNADDFDFSVYGRSKKLPQPVESKDFSLSLLKKRFKPPASDRPVPELDMKGLKSIKVTPEGEMINAVNGLMIACDLSSGRSERRLRLPRAEHEKLLRTFLDSERNEDSDACDISPDWVTKLIKCRSDFRPLEQDAALLIAKRTKEFIQELSQRALQNSEMGLTYDDIANTVDKFDCLSPLKMLIPKKITYKEYIKLNRPKHFMSFT